MNGLDTLREGIAEYLRNAGLDAVTAWEDVCRVRRKSPVIAVSLRGVQGGPAGLMDYLGERLDPESGRWEELYGKRAKITLGLDIYSPESAGEAGCAGTFSRLSEALVRECPTGLRVEELTCGETGFDRDAGLLHCPVQMVCQVFLYAKQTEDGGFTDFRVRAALGG